MDRKIKSINFNEIYIVTPTSNLKTYPRFNKLVNLIKKSEIRINHWYWQRGNAQYSFINLNEKALLSSKDARGSTLLPLYAQFFCKTLIANLRFKPERVYAIGFISALPFAICKSYLKNEFIFDNNDNFSESYNWPTIIKKLIIRLEKFVARKSKIHIIPSRSRWVGDKGNLHIVPNVPAKDDLDEAMRIAKGNKAGDDLGKFTLYVNGLLSDTRGASMILNAFRNLDNKKFKLILAGKIDSKFFEELTKLSNVKYVGEISNIEALAFYYEADMALTFYDPSIEINRKAESTKWGDCMTTGTPFIVNSEIETAEIYMADGLCLHVKYDDSNELIKILNDLLEFPEIIAGLTKKMNMKNIRSWDSYMEEVLQKFLSI